MLMDQAKLAKRIEDVVRMRTILHPKDWQDESQLMMTRWFDYRFMSPIEATMAFAGYYIAGLRSYVRRHVDRELSETVSGIRSGVPTARAAWFTALWRARARTDAIFVPYDLLIDFSFDFSSRRKRYWTMLPHQLHASPKNGEAWWAVFDEAVEDLLPRRMRTVADMPHYRIENDLGLPAQRHCRDLMLSEMRHEHRMLYEQIADTVFIKRHLTLDQALSLAPAGADRAEIQRRAEAASEDRAWEARPVVELDRSDLLPSCFAIAETINETRSPCDTCTLLAHCRNAAAEAIEIAVRMTGKASPVLMADRERKRLNTQKCRDKKRLLPAESSETASV